MGPDSQVKKVELGNLHTDVLPEQTREAFSRAVRLDVLPVDEWYLAGGTALALQVGHRSSEDLDFFTEKKNFDTEMLERSLVGAGQWVTTRREQGTLYGIFHGAKMSCIAYPFFHPSAVHVQCGSLRLLLPDDIAAMKIIAISQRGRKRDFVDLYWFTAVHGDFLSDIISRAVSQYPESNHSMPHFLKSLVYFDDAEDDPMPMIHFKADWESIEAYFRTEVPKVAEKLLKLR